MPTMFLAVNGPRLVCCLKTSMVVIDEPKTKINEKNVLNDSHLKTIL